MYLIINDINESVSFRQPINNKDNTLEIVLVECIIVYSFYNVVNEEKITLPDKKEIKVLPGFYSLKDILNLIPIDIEVNKNTGNLSNSQVIFSDGLEKLINSKSDKPLDMLGKKRLLNLYLDKLNTYENLVDGVPSDHLRTLHMVGDIEYGKGMTFTPKHLMYKRLKPEIINEIDIKLRDKNNNELKSPYPIHVTLDVREKK